VVIIQLVKEFPSFMKPGSPFLYSKELATRPYPDPDKTSPRHHKISLFKIYFKITLASLLCLSPQMVSLFQVFLLKFLYTLPIFPINVLFSPFFLLSFLFVFVSLLHPDIIRQVKSRRMRWEGHVARMGEDRKLYKVLVGKPEGKTPLERPSSRWEDGIRMDLREIGFGGVDWIRLAQDRDWWRVVVSAVMNLRVLAPRS
jgi:hypothetical protein